MKGLRFGNPAYTVVASFSAVATFLPSDSEPVLKFPNRASLLIWDLVSSSIGRSELRAIARDGLGRASLSHRPG
jgi:hypothetical protein